MRRAAHVCTLLLALCAVAPPPWQWKWDRLPDADVVKYRIETAYLDPNFYPCTRTVCGEDCDPLAPGCCVDVIDTCVAYSLTGWALSQEEDQLPAAEASVCTPWDEGPPTGQIIPPVGAVLFINVRGVDAAGNIGN